MADIVFQEPSVLADGERLERVKNFYMEAFLAGNPSEALFAYAGDGFIRHSAGVKSGSEGFISHVTDIVKRFPNRQIEIIRGWEDGAYIFLHVHQNMNDGEHQFVTTEFFEIDENGLLIKHWSVKGDLKGANASGRTQIDGATQIDDLNLTAQNKDLANTMVKECLFPGARPERIEKYFSEEYLQHNPNVPDGLDIVRKLAQAENPPLIYNEIILTVGRGNFVAVLCRSSWENSPLVQVDIVRLKNGKITEHWDLNEAL